MLALFVNNTWLDLKADASISLNLENPIFASDGIGRVFSYPFKLDDTPRNLNALAYANRLDAIRSRRIYSADLYLFGIKFESGRLIISGGSNNSIEAVFQNLDIDILERMEEINIRDVVQTIPVPLITQGPILLQTQAAGQRRIIVDGVLYSYPDALETDTDVVVNWFVTEINAAGIYNDGNGVLGLDMTQVVLEIDFGSIVGFEQISGQQIEQDRHDSFLAFAADRVDNNDHRFCLPTIYCTQPYETNNAWQRLANYYQGGQQRPNSLSLEKEWEHTYLPMVKLKYLIDQITASLNLVGAAGDLYEQTDFQELAIWSNRTVDDVVEVATDGGDRWLNQYKQEVKLANHLPDFTARELLTRRLSVFNFYLQLQDNRLLLKTKVAQIRQAPIDWTDKVEPVYSFDQADKVGFSLEYDSSEDKDLSPRNQFAPFGNGRQTFTFSIFPLYVTNTNDFYGQNAVLKLPVYTANLTSEATGQEEDSGFRLFYYRGLQPDTDETLYPLGTPGCEDVALQELGAVSLELDGPQGIYQTYWRDYAQLLDAPIVRIPIRLDLQDLIELRKWDNARRKFYTDQGELTGIVRSIRIKAGLRGISVADVELAMV